jgi:hypothetical protein
LSLFSPASQKNENYNQSHNKFSSMTRSHDYENIPSAEDVFVDRFDEEDYFEDDQFVDEEGVQERDECEYTSDNELTDDTFTEAEVKKNSLVTEIEEDDCRHKLQHPDFMEYIRKPIPMPSVEEMNACWEQVLKAERDAKAKKFALAYLKSWVSKWLKAKQKRDELAYQQKRIEQLSTWKKIRGIPRAIKQLGSVASSVASFEIQFSQMMIFKNKELEEKKKEEEHFRMIKVKEDAKIAQVKQSQAIKAAAIAREAKKSGMNKNSTWHAERKNQSLAVIKKNSVALSFLAKTQEKALQAKTVQPVVTVAEAGTGRRAMRKIRLQKEAEEQKKQAERLSLVKVEPVKVEPVQVEPIQVEPIQVEPIQVEEESEEAKEAKVSEENMLNLYKQLCIEAVDKKEKEEKEMELVNKEVEEEKKEEDDFISIMTQNMTKNMIKKLPAKHTTPVHTTPVQSKASKSSKTVSLLQFNGLIDQAIKKRTEDDAVYSRRCSAFEELADKEKLADTLKYTSLCRFIASGSKCPHKSCNFAHSIEQLLPKNCKFGLGCKFVRCTKKGWYTNQKFGRTGKTCQCIHPEENQQSFCLRMNLKYTSPVTQTTVTPTPTPVKPAPIQVPIHTSIQSRPQVCSWASIVVAPAPKAEEPQQAPKVEEPTFEEPQPTPKVEEPTVEEPQPTPTVEEPQPTPTVEEPQPTPKVEEPTVKEPQPTPTVEEPQPTPTVEEPQPTPTVEEPQPTPKVEEPLFHHQPHHFHQHPHHFHQPPHHFHQPPPHFHHQPPHFHHQPPHFHHQPPHFHHQPPHFHHQPPHFHHQPPHFHHQPPHFHHQPPHFHHQPPHFHHQPPHFHHQSPHFHQPPHFNHQPPPDFRCQPPHFHHQPHHQAEQGFKTQKPLNNIVFRVPKALAEQTVLSAIKNGIFDFRLEYSD